MKALFFLFVVALGLLVGCASVPDSALAGPGDGSLTAHRSVELTVHGLSCPLCSNNLDGQLRRVAGVEDAVIDLETGAVTVNFAEGHAVSREDLARAVRDAGFTLRDIRPL